MSINDRIEQLSPRLKRLAQVYSQSTYQDADDLYQSMIVTLFERQAADPSFCKQNDSYIIDAGRKAVCLPAMRRAGIESKYAAETVVFTDDEYDDGFIFDALPAPGETPEQAYINLEQALAIADAIHNLSDRERDVLALIVKGVSAKQIAADYGVTRQAVSCYKQRAIAKLQEAVL